MNRFSLIGDIIHALGILLLLVKICKTRSCSGISGVAQVLYLITFITRYLDLGYFYSYFNSAMKNFFISATAFTVFLVFTVFRRTYDREHDSNWMFLLLLPPAILSQFINYEYSLIEVAWAFSLYLETVAMLPQFVMIFKMGQAEITVVHYMMMLSWYQLFYICNWIYRYHEENFWDNISFASGSIQYLLYLVFFIVYWKAEKSAVSGPELDDAPEKETSDIDTPCKGNFVQRKDLTPYYEKAVLALNRTRLVIQRECFGVLGVNRADNTLKTEISATKQRSCSVDAGSAAEKPRRDGLNKISPSAAEAAEVRLTPEVSDKADDVTIV